MPGQPEHSGLRLEQALYTDAQIRHFTRRILETDGALTALDRSQDFLPVRGDGRTTVSLFGCRMRNYVAQEPITNLCPRALIQAMACIDKEQEPYNRTISGIS